ncbi:MAG: hypothetical protein CME63_04945 [Halobacteriovoraceae bacterium]|nr:hypothetical protein [Halobacteriovoraceae bacterium]MBC97072.1 hypothetical protein [Halobacteriovoraceae bacterium]|tara:strand:- start:85063 stop:85614 length:552 start_codon:yes stop_codon:yes gene_type:complete
MEVKKLSYVTLLFILSFQAWAKIPNLDTVDFVDLDQYLGKWYEIARFEQRFQKGCTAVTAEYTLRKDGDIKVLNSCRQDHPNGELKQSDARAWVVDPTTNAKLKVQFFLTGIRIPLFAGNYWILDLGDEQNGPYTHSIVGDDSGDYLWILARTPNISEEKYNELVSKARELGFDTSKLLRTQH